MKHRYLLIFASFLAFMCVTLNTQAQSNQYLHFDGVDDYTELENGSALVVGNTISMAGWFYTDELIYGSGMMSIRAGGTETGEMYLIQLNNGTVECRVYTTTGLHQVVAPAGTIQAGVWQHIAWVFNETTVEFFVDGVSIGSSSASGMFEATDRPFTIGKCLQGGFNFIYKGRADEVSLWNKALSVAEIQDMMANELVGDEANLQVYYKFNQGTPGGNNVNITELIAEGGDPSKNSTLQNFAMMGETSNFNGVLEDGSQAINFPSIPNKLITDPAFELEATATSGLPVSYEVLSGPATVSGSTVTLDGDAGIVTIQASQAGNDDFDPATNIVVDFEVLDPAQVLVETEILHPLPGDVFASSLIPIQVAVKAGIEYPELFSVGSMEVTINDEVITLTNHENGYYTGWWTPTAYETTVFEVNASNNYGESNSFGEEITIVETTNNTLVMAMDEAWVNGDIPSVTQEADLPSHIGAFDQISATLQITCPPGGCDPWDRVSTVEAQGKDGEWYEIIRYLTPYGVACESEIDLTAFASILRGKTKFRANLGTQGNGFEYTLLLDYQANTPDHPYSSITKLWQQTYQFGDMANLQPTEQFNVVFPENTQTAGLKLVSTGHGWGGNNTANAAEFLQNTHHINVNGQQTFEQNNWVDCDPNPDGCSPQNGTWYFDRAGWCPGSIAQYFDYDMTPYISTDAVPLNYVFDESYTDFCHPNNPNCVSGSTCNDCNDGFNPHLIVNSFLISYGDSPMETAALGNEAETIANFSMYPNPSTGIFFIDLAALDNVTSLKIHDYLGREIKTMNVDTAVNNQIRVNLRENSTGIYIVSLFDDNSYIGSKRVIVQ